MQSRDEKFPIDEVVEATRRKVRIHANFEELLADYLSRRVPCIQGRFVIVFGVMVHVTVCTSQQ